MIGDDQMTIDEYSPEYDAFVGKFKPKKTTDDCYTPEIVYDAILAWARAHLIGDAQVVRPFWPGADYCKYDYPDGCVVLDNPPFSIISKITRDYQKAGIRFLLFGPHLTSFSADVPGVTHIIIGEQIVYANGAKIPTAFVTNLMPGIKAVADPELAEIVRRANADNLRAEKRTLPKYAYPDQLLTVSDLAYMAKHGVYWQVQDKHCHHCRMLDSQKPVGKTIFGSGYLLAEKAAAEKAAAEKAAAIRWPLSDREAAIIKALEA